MSKKIRQHLKFYGSVQCVGFRYHAKYVASSIGLTGWVCNEWDDMVEMEAQGTMEQINQMLKTINSSPYIQIDDIRRKDIPLEELENGFHVR